MPLGLAPKSIVFVLSAGAYVSCIKSQCLLGIAFPWPAQALFVPLNYTGSKNLSRN
jgi:hypothetical protein